MKQLLTGLSVSRQYVCLSPENLSHPLSVFLTFPNADHSLDVTSTHVLLGYKPLLILLPLDENVVDDTQTVCLNFTQHSFTPNRVWKGFPSDSRCVARLILKRNAASPLIENRFLFEGVYGEHSFLNPFHQLVNRLRETFRKKNPDNINLPGNLHDQVGIAYSVARIIPLITVGNELVMNMFPTDLHGPVGKTHYVSSLRMGGKANDQVDQQGKLVMSFMPTDKFQFVYSLGKNHMQDMRDAKHFSIHKERSTRFGIPIPASALRYQELKQINSFDAGIHRIHVYEKVHEENLSEGTSLAHIHQFYAQWRIDHGLPTTMLLR